MGDNEEQRPAEKHHVIKIPSYQDVFDTPSAAPRLYNPLPPPRTASSSSSFSDAFSFIKSSEFYTPPPSASSAASTSSCSSSTVTSTTSSVHTRNAILVSHRQKGNPLLKHIRNVKWVFADVVCDYLLGQSSCALYISLRYHLLHPDYLYFRIRELQKNFKLRVVLCHVDVEDVVKPLLEVTRTAMLHDCTLLCAWSLEECGRYLETIKVYENKSADSIREQTDTDYLSRLTHALTSIRHVNKTDVVTLGSTFGSVAHIMDASMEDLARCPGIGEKKVKRLYDTFHEPFKRAASRTVVSAPDASANGGTAEESVKEVREEEARDRLSEEADTSKHENTKDSEPDVRSALTAAFAKYADKVRKKDLDRNTVAEGQSSSMAQKD